MISELFIRMIPLLPTEELEMVYGQVWAELTDRTITGESDSVVKIQQAEKNLENYLTPTEESV